MLFTRGKEHFAPIQYNSFEVGPFETRTQPRPGETYGEMQERAYELLNDMFNIEFERGLTNHLDYLEKMGKLVQERRRR